MKISSIVSNSMKISRIDLSGGVAYRGEGNANLVVSLTGSRTVLR